MPRTIRALAALACLTACASPTEAPDFEVQSWGTMRDVLRQGHSDGRVDLTSLRSPRSYGVGALADLAGEVTIVDGRVLVAVGAGQEVPTNRAGAAGDAAALLVVAEVPAWEMIPLGGCASYSELEKAIAAQLRRRGLDLGAPTPVRIRGRASHLAVHVIAGACPIANPSGPRPWRFAGPVDAVELVGFYVEGAAGRWTHHDRHSHLHAVTDELMGHLDAIALEDAVLLVPTKQTP